MQFGISLYTISNCNPFFTVKVSRIPSIEIIPEVVAPISNQIKTNDVV